MNLRNCGLLVLCAGGLAMAAEPPKDKPPAANEITADQLYEAGRELFDTLAPPEVKEHYEFPDKAQWDAFIVRLQAALASNDLAALAQYEPEARAALTALRTFAGDEEYADWLEERLDYIEAARQSTRLPPPVPPPVLPGRPAQFIPHYELWLQRLQNRPKPARADQLIPVLGAVFTTAGLPAGLVWLAEVESTLNPSARSPAGARGLFQLMPATARELGLSTFLPDERTDPEKSAGAAARLLRTLHGKFGDWPLALAAYNAGAGRVQRALDRQKAGTFAEIAAALPAETRMYVPKVLALVRVRAGLTLEKIAPPRT